MKWYLSTVQRYIPGTTNNLIGLWAVLEISYDGVFGFKLSKVFFQMRFETWFLNFADYDGSFAMQRGSAVRTCQDLAEIMGSISMHVAKPITAVEQGYLWADQTGTS